jgi:hypothetical protein
MSSEWGSGDPLYLMVAVKDTGIGISKEGQTKLFERFRSVAGSQFISSTNTSPDKQRRRRRKTTVAPDLDSSYLANVSGT